MISPIPDLIHDLQKSISGEVRADLATRLLYSTDASIYQIEPYGVAFPRTVEDVSAAVEICARYGVPVLARGAGSSLAGQAIGQALILDLSRHMHRILEIDPQSRTATVEPGVVLNSLNHAAAAFGLGFGPDPASSERATMGGSIANNATGAHSILYGMAADHLLSAEAVLSDGSVARLEKVTLEEAAWRAGFESELPVTGKGLGEITPVSSLHPRLIANRDPQDPSGALNIEANLYRAALRIREAYGEAIYRGWPRTWRRASGYNLNYLLSWSPTRPPLWDEGSRAIQNPSASQNTTPYPPVEPGYLNLAHLLAGSEGTLAVMRRLTVGLVPLPRHTIVAVLAYPSIASACDAVPALLDSRPAAIELIPEILIRLARSIPAYAGQVSFVNELAQNGRDPAALLVVELAGGSPAELRRQAQVLTAAAGAGYIAESPAAQRAVWTVRKVGLGLLLSRPGEPKPVSFIEDLSVPVERLGEFVREIERILEAYHAGGDIYAHASAGCLHIRPLLNLKDRQGLKDLRAIAEQAVDLTFRLGGSVSGEHGDGLARSEWLRRMFGEEILAAFKELKTAADPNGLLNPGKILDSQPMDTNLRYGGEYRVESWSTVLDFSRQAGLSGAIEQCNGAGVCRKAEGTMCPSFQATGEEMHSTRGRANLLRAMISGRFPSNETAERTVYEALDLCLACKGCKAECPSAVDVAKLKYEFMARYYRSHSRKPRDWIFAYIGSLARLGSPFDQLVNGLLHTSISTQLAKRIFNISDRRPFPRLARRSLLQELNHQRSHPSPLSTRVPTEEALFLSDAFTTYFYPETGLAALDALSWAGVEAHVLPVQGAGRTLISKGFLEAAKRHAAAMIAAIERYDPRGELPVIGVEPSEIYTLRDELLDLLPGDPRVQSIASRAYMIDEFLIRPGSDGEPRMARIIRKNPSANISVLRGQGKTVLLHAHCYQKAQPPATDGFPIGAAATASMLEWVGYTVQTIDSGCCGMAGAFGYEVEHFEVSMQVAELKLLPAVRAAPAGDIIAACGVSCQSQIEDGSGRRAIHPVRLI